MRKRVLVIGKSHTNSIPGESKLQEERNGSTHQFIQFLKEETKEIVVLRNKEKLITQLRQESSHWFTNLSFNKSIPYDF